MRDLVRDIRMVSQIEYLARLQNSYKNIKGTISKYRRGHIENIILILVQLVYWTFINSRNIDDIRNEVSKYRCHHSLRYEGLAISF